MTQLPFDDLADAYEAMIDWPKRLENERPFFSRVFQRTAASRVLDAACGPGRHAALFHALGLEVEAADVSPNMIAKARTQFGETAGLRFRVRGFDQPVHPPKAFDVVICIGNSLALAGDLDAAARAVRCMLDALRPGGVLVVQVLNLWRLPDGPCVWQKCKRASLPTGDVVLVKGVHRSGRQGYVDIVVTTLGDTPSMQSESVPFMGIEPTTIEEAAIAAGAQRTMLFGDYQEHPYDRQTSPDLILVAEK